MPSGKVHDKITQRFLIAFIIIFVLGWQYTYFYFIEFIIFLVGYLIGSYYLGPDLDTLSSQYNRWKCLKFLWRPYQKLGGHRSFQTQSHDSLFGLLFRLLYLGVILMGLGLIIFFITILLGYQPMYIIYKAIYTIKYIMQYITPKYIIIIFVGLWTAHLLHVATDWLNKYIKL